VPIESAAAGDRAPVLRPDRSAPAPQRDVAPSRNVLPRTKVVAWQHAPGDRRSHRRSGSFRAGWDGAPQRIQLVGSSPPLAPPPRRLLHSLRVTGVCPRAFCFSDRFRHETANTPAKMSPRVSKSPKQPLRPEIIGNYPQRQQGNGVMNTSPPATPHQSTFIATTPAGGGVSGGCQLAARSARLGTRAAPEFLVYRAPGVPTTRVRQALGVRVG